MQTMIAPPPAVRPLNAAEIRQCIGDGWHLIASGQLEAAAAVIWSAFEAAVRLSLTDLGQRTEDPIGISDSALGLSAQAVAYGVIDPEDRDVLLRLLPFAHGGVEDVDAGVLQELSRFTERTLDELEQVIGTENGGSRQMAVAEPKADVPGITRPMTYEEYISGPEEMARYDILDGWKVYRLYGDNLLPSPTRKHQNIALNLAEAFRSFQRAARLGQAIIAPCDVEITYQPLRSRQPDLLFMSRERLEQNAPSDQYAPLSPAPELVVEIVSPSDTASVLAAKIADYRAVDVREVWIVRSGDQIVEVMRLSAEQIEISDVYGLGDAAASQVFPGLVVPVASIFSQE